MIRIVRLAPLMLAVMSAGLLAASAGAQPVADEYQVKAAYLLNFDINRSPANAAQLSISSKLLSVARAVREGSAAR